MTLERSDGRHGRRAPRRTRGHSRRVGSAAAWSAPLAALALALALLGAGCLGGSSNTATTTDEPATTSTPPATTTAPAATRTVRIYVVRDGKLVAEGREVPAGPAVGSEALKALLGARAFDLTIAGGVATVTGLGTLSHEGQAEIVATLTQFPTVQAVELDGKRLTRLDIEDVTPQILVESPLPGARVASPLRVTGTANTFEASLFVDVLDADGNTLSHKLVTATSGSGTRGTFDVQIGFDTADSQPGTLYAYESSAEDGRAIHEVRVPLTLLP
jgi:hypothetical protein